jgi:Transposase
LQGLIGILKEHDAGAEAEDLCRRHGISGTTFYKWKAKFGGMEVSPCRPPRPYRPTAALTAVMGMQIFSRGMQHHHKIAACDAARCGYPA